MSQTKEQAGVSTGSRLLALSPVLLLFALLAATWSMPVLEAHGFRQTQTLISSYWMAHGGPWWLYDTPLLGYPWKLPFEFPLYQWGVAMLAASPLGLDFDAAGRLLSAMAMIACVWPLRQILWNLSAPARLVNLSTALFLLSPLHLFWGRAAMIESTALLLSLVFVVAIQGLIARVTKPRLLAAVAFAVLAALVKITTFFTFALLAGGLVSVTLFRRLRARDVRGAVLLAAAAGVPILLSLLALQSWLHASDALKLGSVLAEFTTSDNLSGWNFDRTPLGMQDAFWRDAVWRRMVPDILGYAVWLAPMVVLLLAPSKRHWLAWLAMALMLFLAPMLVFSRLHFTHDYYQMANATFLILALAIVLHGASENWRGWLAGLLAVVAAAGMLMQLYGGYWRLIRDFDPSHPSLVVAAALRQHTAPDDVVVMMGLTWSSEVPYYSKRRAVMLMQEEYLSFVPPLLRAPGNESMLRLGGVLRCGAVRADITDLEPLFCGPMREVEVGGCSIVVRRDPGPSTDAQSACERDIAARVQASMAPRISAGNLLLAPFHSEWVPMGDMDSCGIEFAGANATPATDLARDQSLTVGGWMLERAGMTRPAKPMLRLRSDSMGRSWYVPLDTVVDRPDLVEFFGAEQARSGGFKVTVPLAQLPPSRYELMLVDQSGDMPVLCRTGKTLTVH